MTGDQSQNLAELDGIETSSKQSQKRDPGSLVYVTANSKVSVNLDEFATDPAMLARIVTALKAKDSQFWIDRATEQIWLTQHRFVFRPLFIAGRYQLPLTQPNHWILSFTAMQHVTGRLMAMIQFTSIIHGPRIF